MEVKMDKRTALRLLKKKDCTVKLGASEFVDKEYHTRHDDFIDDVIFIREQGMYQDYTLITHILYKDRFGCEYWMCVDWDK